MGGYGQNDYGQDDVEQPMEYWELGENGEFKILTTQWSPRTKWNQYFEAFFVTKDFL